MSKPRFLRLLTLAAAVAAALALAEPALAFDPQPDPPGMWWDVMSRIWRFFGR